MGTPLLKGQRRLVSLCAHTVRSKIHAWCDPQFRGQGKTFQTSTMGSYTMVLSWTTLSLRSFHFDFRDLVAFIEGEEDCRLCWWDRDSVSLCEVVSEWEPIEASDCEQVLDDDFEEPVCSNWGIPGKGKSLGLPLQLLSAGARQELVGTSCPGRARPYNQSSSWGGFRIRRTWRNNNISSSGQISTSMCENIIEEWWSDLNPTSSDST